MATTMASYYVPQGPSVNSISDIERELEELRSSYRQVCEERDALEDLLLQEQLKNGTPADKQLEEARAHAAALEVELQSAAARCDEWKRRAGERAAEMHPALVQALLEERLEELDESGVIALQVECARLRDELAKSEVLRFELYRSLAQGAVAVGSRWESESGGLTPSRESSFGLTQVERLIMDHNEDAPGRQTTPAAMECDESVVQELLELGQASLTQEDVRRLSEAVEAAERRAEQAERDAEQRAVQVQLLEAKMSAMINESPSDQNKRSPSLVSSSPISFRLSPVASSSSPGSSNTSQHDHQQQQNSSQHEQRQHQRSSQHDQQHHQSKPQPGQLKRQSSSTEAQSRRDRSGGGLAEAVAAGQRSGLEGATGVSRASNVIVSEEIITVTGTSQWAGAASTLKNGGAEAGGKEEEEEAMTELEEDAVESGVEELKEMVRSVRRQNRFTHLLLSVVLSASIPPLIGFFRSLFPGQRPYQPNRRVGPRQ